MGERPGRDPGRQFFQPEQGPPRKFLALTSALPRLHPPLQAEAVRVGKGSYTVRVSRQSYHCIFKVSILFFGSCVL